MAGRSFLITLSSVASFALSVDATAVAKPNTCQKLVDLFGDKVSLPSSKEYALVAPGEFRPETH
jgi:hypothetical protein